MSAEDLPKSLVVNDQLTLVRTEQLDGLLWDDMMREDDAESLPFNSLNNASRDCHEWYDAMNQGTMLSYWIDRRGAKIGHITVQQVSDYPIQENHWVMEYMLTKANRGQRLMVPAARTLLEYGFDADIFTEVDLDITPENAASQRVAARLGGTLVEEESEEGVRLRWRVNAHD